MLPMSLRVLRAFLGVTFVYAGAQKLLDPNFLHAGSPTYIGSQLQAFSQGSPIAGLLRVLENVPVLAGASIALLELGIGLGTLLGIAPLASAVAGFAVNLALTLSATWHVHPYFLGSDSMYAVGWVAYAVGMWESDRRRRAGTKPKDVRGRATPTLGRREFLRGAFLAVVTIVAGAASLAFAGSPSPARALGGASRRLRSGAGRGSGGGAAGSSGSASSPSAASGGSAGSTFTGSGTPVASLSQLPVGSATGFDAPGVGPAVLVRLGQDRVDAYSRVCTHAGCLVGYDPSTRILVCPCHGAEFDPAHGAAPIAGPAPTPLARIRVVVDPSSGEVILPS